MKLLIIALVSVGLVYGQECQDEVMGFARCIQGAMEEGMPSQEQRSQHKEAVDACFVDNGCDAPERKTEEEKQCMKDVIKSELGDPLQECLADRDVDVSDELMEMVFEGGHKMMKAFKGRMGGRMGRRMGRKLQRKANKLCNSDEAAAAAIACVMDIKEERMADGPDMFEKIAAVKQCKDEELSEECFQAMKDTKEDLCECGRSLNEDDELLDAVADGIEDCREDDDDEEDEDDEDSSSESDSDSSSSGSSSSGSSEYKMRKVGRKLRKVFRAVCGGRGMKGPFRMGPPTFN